MTKHSTARAACLLGLAMALAAPLASPAFADGRWEHHGGWGGGHDRRDWHGGGGGGGIGLGGALLGLGVGVAVGAAIAQPPPVYYAPPPPVYYGN